MTIGERISKRRQELGLTADEIAEKLGKSRATVYRYENGEIESLPTTVLEPLAKVLRTTPAFLMGWTDNPDGGSSEQEQAEKKSASELSETDKKVLELFNQLKTEDQEMVLKIIRNSLK